MQRQPRVIVPLEVTEANALYEMCETDCRHPKEMARYLIRQEAIRRGLITDTRQIAGVEAGIGKEKVVSYGR